MKKPDLTISECSERLYEARNLLAFLAFVTTEGLGCPPLSNRDSIAQGADQCFSLLEVCLLKINESLDAHEKSENESKAFRKVNKSAGGAA